EDHIEETLPHRIFHVRPELNADASQHEQPEHHHQGKVEAAETGGVELGKSKIKCAARGQQPDFVSVPDWPDRPQDHTALGAALHTKQEDHAAPKTKPTNNSAPPHNHRHNHEPKSFHKSSSEPLRVR